MCISSRNLIRSGIMKPVNRWRSRRIESRGNYADYKIRRSAKFDLRKWHFVRADRIQDGIRWKPTIFFYAHLWTNFSFQMQRLLSDQFDNTRIANICTGLLKDICGSLVKTNAEWWKKRYGTDEWKSNSSTRWLVSILKSYTIVVLFASGRKG